MIWEFILSGGLTMIPLLLCAGIACMVVFVMTYAPDPPVADTFKPNQADANAFANTITTATNDEEGRELLRLLGMPFRR